MTNASVLVTDGDGNIGSEVISQLSSKSNNVRIVGGIRSLSKKRISTRDQIIMIL